MLKVLSKAKKELMLEIQREANGTSKYLIKVMPVIKNFFGE